MGKTASVGLMRPHDGGREVLVVDLRGLRRPRGIGRTGVASAKPLDAPVHPLRTVPAGPGAWSAILSGVAERSSCPDGAVSGQRAGAGTATGVAAIPDREGSRGARSKNAWAMSWL